VSERDAIERAAQEVESYGQTWGAAYRSVTDTLAAAIRALPAAPDEPSAAMVELGDLPSRMMGWAGKARARGIDRIELDLRTVDKLLAFIALRAARDAGCRDGGG